MFLNGAGAAPAAGVAGVGSDAPSEEALAGLAAQHTEVVPGRRVAAHSAKGLAGAGLRREAQRAGRRLCGLGEVRVGEVRPGNGAIGIRGRSAEILGAAAVAVTVASAAHRVEHLFHKRFSAAAAMLVAVVGRRVRRPGVGG